MPPIPILPATVLPQQIDLLVGTPGFQAVDRFLARAVLTTQYHIEVDLTAAEAAPALGGHLLLHHRIPSLLCQRVSDPRDRHAGLLGAPPQRRVPA
jgi:hypothetical protein